MRRNLQLFIAFIIIGCGDRVSNEQGDSQIAEDSGLAAIKADSVQKQMNRSEDVGPQNWDRDIQLCDTVTPKGNFIRHIADTSGNVFVVWGTAAGTIDTMANEFAGWPQNCVIISGENDRFIALTAYGKGLPHLWLLPRNNQDTVQFFPGVVAFDMQYNLVLTDSDSAFVLQNFAFSKRREFPVSSVSRITYSIPIFDSIRFQKGAVYLEWTDEDEKNHTLLQKL